MTQKILAAHAGLDQVTAGQLIEADLDMVRPEEHTSELQSHYSIWQTILPGRWRYMRLRS